MTYSDLPDWEEVPDETPPEQLQRKWIERESFESKRVVCPSCGKEAPAENLTCVFCLEPLSRNTGLLGQMLSGFKMLFRWMKR